MGQIRFWAAGLESVWYRVFLYNARQGAPHYIIQGSLIHQIAFYNLFTITKRCQIGYLNQVQLSCTDTGQVCRFLTFRGGGGKPVSFLDRPSLTVGAGRGKTGFFLGSLPLFDFKPFLTGRCSQKSPFTGKIGQGIFCMLPILRQLPGWGEGCAAA